MPLPTVILQRVSGASGFEAWLSLWSQNHACKKPARAIPANPRQWLSQGIPPYKQSFAPPAHPLGLFRRVSPLINKALPPRTPLKPIQARQGTLKRGRSRGFLWGRCHRFCRHYQSPVQPRLSPQRFQYPSCLSYR